jgi:FkbM family methyltransferase
MQYNRDWPLYIWAKFQSRPDTDLLTFRLRNGQTVRVKPAVRFVLNEIYLDRAYDVPETDLSSSKAILDVGANVGIFTLYCSSVAPGARIYCLEPSSKNFELLKENIALNSAKATPYHVALAPETGNGFLSLAGESTEYALGSEGPLTETVECVDLDRALEMTGVESFDLVKIDIEGVEREVFQKVSDATLKRIKALSLEWHHSIEELDQLAQRFRRLGFKTERQILPVNVRYLKAWQPAARHEES